MRKAGFKRMRGVKENYVQDRLRLKRIFCTSIKHVRWMKRYINRAPRHKEKREDIDGKEKYTEAVSGRDADFVYKVGEMVSVDDFCKNRWEECAAGIHFFMNRKEAVDYWL